MSLSRHTFWSHSFLHSLASTLPLQPPKIKENCREKKEKIKNLIMEVVVWHSESPSESLCPCVLLTSVPCKEPLDCFQAFGFYCTINAGSSPRLFGYLVIGIFTAGVSLSLWGCPTLSMNLGIYNVIKQLNLAKSAVCQGRDFLKECLYLYLTMVISRILSVWMLYIITNAHSNSARSLF